MRTLQYITVPFLGSRRHSSRLIGTHFRCDRFAGCGAGVTGWVEIGQDGTLGCMQYDANIIPAEICNGFEIAYCAACKPCPPMYNASFNPGANCTKCIKPSPSPPPPAPPPAPPGGTPCIRFGNTIPSDHIVDATIMQGATNYTWTGYRFSQFSGWISIFREGTGTITLTDHGTGENIRESLVSC